MRYFVLAMTAILIVVMHGNAAEPTTKPIPFDTHDGYFVSNKFEPDSPTSFVVLKDQKAFDGVFGAAFVMRDKSHRLPPKAFETKMVVAAIHRGKATWTYTVESVVPEGKTLVIKYTTKSTQSDSAEFSCPLIISLDKSDYAAVQFVEDGKTMVTQPIAAKADLTESEAKELAAEFLKGKKVEWGDPTKIEKRENGDYWVLFATSENEVKLLSYRTVIVGADRSVKFLPRR